MALIFTILLKGRKRLVATLTLNRFVPFAAQQFDPIFLEDKGDQDATLLNAKVLKVFALSERNRNPICSSFFALFPAWGALGEFCTCIST